MLVIPMLLKVGHRARARLDRCGSRLERQLRPRPHATAARLAGHGQPACAVPAGAQDRRDPHRRTRRARPRPGRARERTVEWRRHPIPARDRRGPPWPARRAGYQPDDAMFEAVEPALSPATCGGLRVWSVYVPTAREPGHPHYAYKLRWLDALQNTVEQELGTTLRSAGSGDFNIAPTDADVCRDPAVFATSTHVTRAGT